MSLAQAFAVALLACVIVAGAVFVAILAWRDARERRAIERARADIIRANPVNPLDVRA